MSGNEEHRYSEWFVRVVSRHRFDDNVNEHTVHYAELLPTSNNESEAHVFRFFDDNLQRNEGQRRTQYPLQERPLDLSLRRAPEIIVGATSYRQLQSTPGVVEITVQQMTTCPINPSDLILEMGRNATTSSAEAAASSNGTTTSSGHFLTLNPKIPEDLKIINLQKDTENRLAEMAHNDLQKKSEQILTETLEKKQPQNNAALKIMKSKNKKLQQLNDKPCCSNSIGRPMTRAFLRSGTEDPCEPSNNLFERIPKRDKNRNCKSKQK